MSFQSHFIKPNIEVFFGDKHHNHDYHSLSCRLKQVHSSTVVEANNHQVFEADAHFTQQPGLELCILTADCMPIMMTDGTTVAAVHAGWKGLFTGILTNVIKTCFSKPESTAAFIGPHIHQNSFEFGKDTLKEYQIYKPIQECPEAIKDSAPGKVLIDLKALAEHELKSHGINTINSLNIDTFTSSDHHSYRRDRENSGRNLSWIKIQS